MPYVIGGVFSFGIMVNLITDVFRHLFFFLDGIIYGLIPIVFNLIHTLYDFSSLLNEEALINIFKNVSATIYSFLAIFMFFRVAFSLISMLVDPSIIDDKEKGAKNIIKNIMICLILIVVVPYGFNMAKNIQAKVIDEQLIEKVVAGEKFDDDYNLGDELSRTILGVFMYPTTEGDHAADVYKSVFDAKNEKLAAMHSVLTDVTGNPIVNLLNLNLFSDKTHYSIGYLFGLSTFVGGYVLFVIIGLMVDIGYRAIKLIALELISPIAIVSYIDPSSGKKGVFSKWLNETIKTYLSLFIRIFVFSFVSVLLSALNFSQLNGEAGLFTKIFYILAIIAFIKSAPKFIDNLFGTSISKDGESNLAKGLKTVLAVTGMGTGAVSKSISNAVVAKRVGQSRMGVFKAAVTGAWQGGTKGYAVGKKGGLAGMTGVVSNTYSSYADAKKQFGYNRDPEQEKLINELEQRVEAVDAAKSAAVDNLMANNKQKYNQILENGPKVNGRKYGKGLENDDGLENALKKNAGGLAKDEALHADDRDYMDKRRLVADRKEAEAIVSRTSVLAKAQYNESSDGFNSADDKNGFLLSFRMDTEKIKFGEINEQDLNQNFIDELQKWAPNFVQEERLKFGTLTDAAKIQLLIDSNMYTEDEIAGMDMRMIEPAYDKILKSKIDSISANYQNGTKEDKIKLTLDIKKDNLRRELSTMSEYDLSVNFAAANEERIKATYGHSLTNIEADAAKVSGEVKDAQAALDDYLKSGKGKKAKSIDSAYSLADSAYKAKKLAQKQRDEDERNRAMQNNN